MVRKNKCGLRQSLTLQLYGKLVPVQILSAVTVSVCTVINSFIINRAFGETGLSQIKIVDAFTNMIVIINLLISAGVVLLVGRGICKGEQKSVDRFLSTAIALAVLSGAFVCGLCFIIPSQICTFFGADSQMLPECCKILQGNSLYYISIPLCSVFLSLFQIHSDLKTPIISSLLILLVNTSFSYIFLCVLHLDIYFKSVANSAAQALALCYLLIKGRKKKLISFSFKGVSAAAVGTLFAVGFTDVATVVWSVVKDSLLVKICAGMGDLKALSCYAIVGNVDAVTFALVVPAFQLATLMIGGIFIHEGDRAALKKFAKTAFGLSIGLAAVLSAVMFFTAYPAAELYHVENIQSYVKAQRIFAFAILPFLPYTVLITLYAALDKKRAVNIISFFTALILPLLSIILLSRLFGFIGFWYGTIVGHLLGLMGVLLYSVIYNRHIPRSMEELLCLDKHFGVEAAQTFSLSITNVAEATGASKKIMQFCRANDLDERTAYFSGLCLEEIAVNIVTHGFRHRKRPGVCELVVIRKKNKIRLIVRDNCLRFDLREKLAAYDEADITKGIGIRIVTGLAQISYKNMYGLNILTMTLEAGRKE